MTMPPKPKEGLIARRAAVRLIDEVLENQRPLTDLTSNFRALPAAEKARAMRLATTVLRNLGRADQVLIPYLKKPPLGTVMNILRLAVTEICHEGAQDYAVVDSAVAMTRKLRNSSHFAGLVNAVLRKVAKDGPAAWAAETDTELPDWVRLPLIKAYGVDGTLAIEAAHAAPPPVDLTFKNGVSAGLVGEMLPNGSMRMNDAGQISILPGFESGDWWVQDAAATFPVLAMAPKPGERVLDMCAAPGGKTMQMAAMGAKVTAVDQSAERIKVVHENLARTGLDAEVIVADAFDLTEGGYDAILLDAPCSATGTLRRHPDLPFVKDGKDVGAIVALQGRMLDHALTLLKPGGRLVYCTCSLFPQEGEIQVQTALERHKGLKVLDQTTAVVGLDAAWRTKEGGVRLRPDYWGEKGGMDGFYFAVLGF